jgi:DNA-binding transcriptional regulator YhcF (GntR family)
MAYNPDDKRSLFQRVVDDITDQIRRGELPADAKVPSAKALAEEYDIAGMTAQRALRELQTAGLTYGVPGRGSFVHPDALARILGGDAEADERQAVATWVENRTALESAMTELSAALAAADIDRAGKARDALDELITAISRELERPQFNREIKTRTREGMKRYRASERAKTTEGSTSE